MNDDDERAVSNRRRLLAVARAGGSVAALGEATDGVAPDVAAGGDAIATAGGHTTVSDPPAEPSRTELPVFEAYGRLEDGYPVLDRSAVYGGGPVDPIEVADHEQVGPSGDGTTVEVQLLGPRRERTVRETTVRDTEYRFHPDRSLHAIVASLPFDERGVWLRADRDGSTTQLNAIVHPVRDAVRRVPVRGFETGKKGRTRLLELLGSVDEAVRAGRFEVAAATLRERFAPAVDSALRPYEPLPHQPDADGIAALVERMVARLDGL